MGPKNSIRARVRRSLAAAVAVAVGASMATVSTAAPAQALVPNYTIVNVTSQWTDGGGTVTSGVDVPFQVRWVNDTALGPDGAHIPRSNEAMTVDLVAVNGKFPYPMPDDCESWGTPSTTSSISRDRRSMTCYTHRDGTGLSYADLKVTPQWEGASMTVRATVRGASQTSGVAAAPISRAVNVVGSPPPPEYFVTQGTVAIGGKTTFPGTMTATFPGFSPAPSSAACVWSFAAAGQPFATMSRDCSWAPTERQVAGVKGPRVRLQAYVSYGGDRNIPVVTEIAYNGGVAVGSGTGGTGTGTGSNTGGTGTGDNTGRKQIKLRSKPWVAGKVKVGKRLELRAGKARTKGVKVRYRWFRGRTMIKGFTGNKATYKVKRADKGKRITCRVIYRKAGYKTLRIRATKR